MSEDKGRKHGALQLSNYLLTEVIRVLTNFWNLFNHVSISTSAINHSLMIAKILDICCCVPPPLFIFYCSKMHHFCPIDFRMVKSDSLVRISAIDRQFLHRTVMTAGSVPVSLC